MEILCAQGEIFTFKFLANCRLRKLSELPVSIRALVDTPFMITGIKAQLRQTGGAAAIRVAITEVEEEVGESDCEQILLHTFEKCPHFVHKWQVALIAGHIVLGPRVL